MLRKQQPVLLREIGKSGHFDPREVRAILNRLQVGGLIRRLPGRGYVLAKAPGEIRLLDVLRAVDVPKPPNAPCGGNYEACLTHAACILEPLCRKVQEAYDQTLREFTLADLENVRVDLPNCVDPALRTLAT